MSSLFSYVHTLVSYGEVWQGLRCEHDTIFLGSWKRFRNFIWYQIDRKSVIALQNQFYLTRLRKKTYVCGGMRVMPDNRISENKIRSNTICIIFLSFLYPITEVWTWQSLYGWWLSPILIFYTGISYMSYLDGSL